MHATIKRWLCGALIGTALSGPAVAGEQLVMPFACRVADGQVSLAPSAPQVYQIYGEREHKQLTTCSPFDPRKCHSWFVHRFDLDCGGARASWQSVVAALSPMLAESVGPPGDAYAGSYGEPPPQRFARPYRPGLGPPITFPRGFAPNPMRVARFEQTEAAHSAAIALPPKKPDPIAPTQLAEPQPNLKPAEPSSPEKADAAIRTAPDEKKTTEVAEYRVLQIEIDSGSEVTGSLTKDGAILGTLWRDAGLIFITLAALLALSARLLLRRRGIETLPMPVPLLRQPARLTSFSRTSVGRGDGAAAQQRDVSATRPRLWDEDWLPATMSEALDVLGVDPDASRVMMKSTVTRLRRALHPDHALDEEDRRLRERRLKQINVAWDIVSGKRHSLWLSVKPQSS